MDDDEIQFLNELFKLAGERAILLEEPFFAPEYKSNADVEFSEVNKELLGSEFTEQGDNAIQ